MIGTQPAAEEEKKGGHKANISLEKFSLLISLWSGIRHSIPLALISSMVPRPLAPAPDLRPHRTQIAPGTVAACTLCVRVHILQ